MGAYESMHATCQEMKIIDCILGKIPFSSDMDYNSDGILDVSDHLNMWQGLGGGIP